MELLILLLILLNNGYRFPNPTPQIESTEVIVTPSKLSGFIYPDSDIVEYNNNNISLQSSDDVSKITDWYQEKVSNSGSITTFNKSKINDVISNLLISENYEVLIKKSPNDLITFIEVSLK